MRLTRVCLSYFKKYVDREVAKSTGVLVYNQVQGWRVKKIKPSYHYTEDRPWTEAAKNANLPHISRPRLFLEPIKDWIIFLGDRVEVLVGKDKGKQGLVNSIIKERNWCFVEGLHCKYKWENKSPTSPGQLVKVEQPLLVTSEVSLVDPSDNKTTWVEWRYTEAGERVRVSARTGRILPLARAAQETMEDFVVIRKYVENDDKDTKSKELTEITFTPALTTFEHDIMDKMGIEENRKPAPTFWY